MIRAGSNRQQHRKYRLNILQTLYRARARGTGGAIFRGRVMTGLVTAGAPLTDALDQVVNGQAQTTPVGVAALATTW
jgi:hypothetical protein